MNLRGKYIAFLIAGVVLLGLSFSSIYTSYPFESHDQEPQDLSEGPWPSFGRDMGNNRLSPYNTSHIDGTVDWTYKGGPAIRSSPAIGSNGTMYFGSIDRNLYAVDVEDGKELWNFNSDEVIISSPAVSEDEIIYFGSGDENIYALNSDGSLRWKYETDGAVFSSPTVDEDGNVYVGSYDHNLYSLNQDGELNWKFTSDSWLWSSPSISEEGVVFVGSGDGNLYAIDKTDGTELWNYSTDGYIYSSPAIVEDGIYFGSYDGNLYALDKEGNLKWNFDCGAHIHTSPGVDQDGTVYFGARNGNVYGVKEGTEKWTFETDDRVRSSPALSSDGFLYIGSDDGNIYALNTGGEKVWSYETEDNIYSSPAIGEDGKIYVGSVDGNMYSFGASDDDIELDMEIWREVKMTFMIAGRPGNSITAVLQEDGEEIEDVELIREPGRPQVETVEFKYRTEGNYSLDIHYESEGKGANPVWTSFISGFRCRVLFDLFHHNSDDHVVYDLNDEIGDMISRVRKVHFSVVGDFDEDNVLSYQWDFGDGNNGEGRNTSHFYFSTGVYDILLTVTFETGEVIVLEGEVEIGENCSEDNVPPGHGNERENIIVNRINRRLRRTGKQRNSLLRPK